jgi:hypothetical protein
MTSSKNARTVEYNIPWNIFCMRRLKIALPQETPAGSLLNLKAPFRVIKVVNSEVSGSSGIDKYALLKSTVEKYLHPPRLSKMASHVAIGY